MELPVRWVPVLLLAACSSGELVWPEATGEAVLWYAGHVEARYGDSLSAAEDLDRSLEALVAAPSAAALDDAREAWLASREPYLLTEVFRFYDGPIDDPEDGPEGLINAWPLDEQYLDYVVGDTMAGVVNGTDPIDGPSLVALNEVGGEKNIATGYHAVEFLLWGQDTDPAGPGARPHTDYVTGEGGTAANQDRRGEALTVIGDLLVEHLGQVHAEWEAGAAYRSTFEADPQLGFERILTGMIILSGFETGGERLQAALDSGDQEDEHSCFSDNTHRDMVQDVRGVLQVWQGDGSEASVRGVVAEVDPLLADEVDAKLTSSLGLAEALQPPFDQEIAAGSPGRERVQALVTSLREQEELLFSVFSAFDLSVTIPE